MNLKSGFLFLSLFFAASFSVAALPTHLEQEQEFVTPAEPQANLRSKVIPCFNQEQDGVGRRLNLSHVEGERCSPRMSSPNLPDKPDGEAESPGMPFQKKAL